ncbi:MAG: FecR domain-containing protein [Niastella sp.]|nr:FecR domain-containing protein [Niastella sp.]
MHESAVNRIVHLLLQQQKSEITEQEQQELDTWTNASEANRLFIQRCLDQPQVAASLEQMDKIDEEAAWQTMIQKNELEFVPIIPIRRRKTWQWVAAAAVVGVLATGAYLFLRKDVEKATPEVAVIDKGENIQPGTNKATLTLGDGRTITLDEQKDGVLAKENGAAVNKQGDALVYNPDEQNAAKAGAKTPVTYNTVTTPRGGSFAVTLPDNSKVWLNAAASIRFPTAFTGAERRVEISGEAYFEVAKNTTQPFIVDILAAPGGAHEGAVKVLGTHFNIRAYDDEATVKTTLLEGSVQMVNAEGDRKVILKPTQQGAISNQSPESSKIMVQTVDIESVVAWKNGYFDFKAAPLSDILKEVKRWYSDIDDIQLQITADEAFTAPVPRNVPLSTMLKILESTDRVHFQLKGKTLIVTK